MENVSRKYCGIVNGIDGRSSLAALIPHASVSECVRVVFQQQRNGAMCILLFSIFGITAEHYSSIRITAQNGEKLVNVNSNANAECVVSASVCVWC